jgi:hypothetical protein
MAFWYCLLAVVAGTAAGLVTLGRRRRLSILALVPMTLAHMAGLVLVLAGLIEWAFDPFAAVGEYGDGSVNAWGAVVPLLLVGGVLLPAAWIPVLRSRA